MIIFLAHEHLLFETSGEKEREREKERQSIAGKRYGMGNKLDHWSSY
jgi:hypothetical protein